MSNWIAITGGTGYIGSHVAAEIKDNTDKSVLLIDKNGYAYPNATRYCDIFADEDFASDLIQDVIQKYKPKTVIHCAEDRGADFHLVDPLKIWHETSKKNSIFLRTCAMSGVEKFIFLSSADIYAGNKSSHNENDRAWPISCWARNKLMIEQMLRDCYMSHGMKSVSLRLSKVAGTHNIKDIGPLPHATDVFSTLMQNILNKHIFEVYGNDFETIDGTPVRDFIHVLDVVSAVMKADAWLDNTCGSFIFNCGSGTATSIMQLISATGEALGKTINHTYVGREPGKPGQLTIDIDLISSCLEWKPKHNLLDMILSTYKWYAQDRTS
jgi:UDP-glucose 4-epimerase